MSMKIQVSVKTMEKGAATAKVEMTVAPTETVKSVKEKVAAAQLIAFPEHKLVCGGEKLDEKKTLGDCGVTEASAVEFVLEATERALWRSSRTCSSPGTSRTTSWACSTATSTA
jgi:hypothetical protein